MLKSLKRRLTALRNDEGGFTLTELLVVIMIIGILLAIAIPAYLGFRERANQAAANSTVRAVIPAVETYFSDNNTYAGMTQAALAAIDAGTPGAAASATADGLWIPAASQTATSYCVQYNQNGKSGAKTGPAAQVGTGTC